MRRLSTQRRRRGIFTADALIALAILAVLATVLAIALGQQRKSLRALADSRAAARLAENRLLALQAAAAPEPLPPEADLAIAPAPGGAAVPGQAWVQITATLRGRKVTLVGLVPAAAVTEERP